MIVFKMGRTTGPTVGVVHGCRAIQRVYYSAGPTQSRECVVLPYDDSMPFARAGDSGALIYSDVGQGVGVIWGSSIGSAPQSIDLDKFVYYTPLDVIYNDMSAHLARLFGENTIRLTWVL